MFTFQQFHIDDGRCAMKVGTDGVLLGAWADLAGCRHIVDLGAGSGLIALMAAQRAPAAHVSAVEIDPEAVADALNNVKHSPFAGRIDVVCENMLAFSPPAAAATTENARAASPAASAAREGGSDGHAGCRRQPIDCVLTNPPYFEEELLPPDAARATARHTAGLSFAALIHTAKRLLTPAAALSAAPARFALILPTPAVAHFSPMCLLHGFTLRRRTDVVTKAGKQPKRTLLEYALKAPEATLLRAADATAAPQTDTLSLMTADGARSPEYAALCKDFYLPR